MAMKRILLADDEPSVLNITGRMLEHLGYEAEMCSESTEALECFLSEPESIHLLIADLSMRGMGGIELDRKVLETRPDVPVILCSGLLESEIAERAGADYIHAMLSKPILLQDLKAAVQSALYPKGDSGPSS